MRTEKEWDERARIKSINRFPPLMKKNIEEITNVVVSEEIESSYIFGNTHTGKTVLACFMLLQEEKNIFMEGGPKHKDDFCELISVADLINKFKSCYEKKYEGPTESAILKQYQDIRLLVLDDFGTVKPTDWALHLLYSIIDHRNNWLKKTIFTSNLSLEEASIVLGDTRITSRIERMCTLIKKQDYKK